MSDALTRLCAAHGIQTTYVGIDGVERPIDGETLQRLAEAFHVERAGDVPPPSGIAEARAERSPPRCHVPEDLKNARVWGLTCQLPALASDRNLGMGDFADLAAFCKLAAGEGADFVGLNPLHALFWSDPAKVSPFFPSNRRFLNPLYLALDWIEGAAALTPEEDAEARALRATPLLDIPGVARLKDRLLRRAFQRFPWDAQSTADFQAFREEGGDGLEAHALFEALSVAMARDGLGSGWPGWPEPYRHRASSEVAAFAAESRPEIDYHLWLQWQTDRQLGRVQHEARQAGMRVGLYLDFAVGAAPDGSAAWTDPELTVPGASIGAPPDYFNARGQDWGLAPLSPVKLAETGCHGVAEIMAAVMRHAGAVRIDHAMSLARLWLIPRGMTAAEGAYVAYPLRRLLRCVAGASQEARTLVIGEDLGVVPAGFREMMEERSIHAYKVFYFERGPKGYDLDQWPADALACLGTHDMSTFAGRWRGSDLDLWRDLGILAEKDEADARADRAEEIAAIRAITAPAEDVVEISARLHAYMASSPCRLAALQIEDALGVEEQVNVPGTVDEHPNWRRRLPVAVGSIADHPGFRAHTAAMRAARPR